MLTAVIILSAAVLILAVAFVGQGAVALIAINHLTRSVRPDIVALARLEEAGNEKTAADGDSGQVPMRDQ